jgi:nicotinate-nucleotide adenylyltransferase
MLYPVCDLPYAAQGQTVGLYGGSFDPVHEGHVQTALTALKALQLDWLWWVVSPGQPLKGRTFFPLEERVQRIRKKVHHPRMKVTDFETALASHRSIDTLHFLQCHRPDLHFVWIVGADHLAHFHLWAQWQALAERVPVAVVDRPGYAHAALSSPFGLRYSSRRLPDEKAKYLAWVQPPVWSLIRGVLSPMSSTQIRMAQRDCGNLKEG